MTTYWLIGENKVESKAPSLVGSSRSDLDLAGKKEESSNAAGNHLKLNFLHESIA